MSEENQSNSIESSGKKEENHNKIEYYIIMEKAYSTLLD
jgi:hypothetical protein